MGKKEKKKAEPRIAAAVGSAVGRMGAGKTARNQLQQELAAKVVTEAMADGLTPSSPELVKRLERARHELKQEFELEDVRMAAAWKARNATEGDGFPFGPEQEQEAADAAEVAWRKQQQQDD
jgi:hypothetical protein